MRRPGRMAPVIPWGLALLGAALALCLPGIAAGAGPPPLPASDYAVRGACSAPPPGHVGCLALTLEPQTSAARSRTHRFVETSAVRTAGLKFASECASSYASTCLTPQDLRSAYFPGEEPQAPTSDPQTIALVDAYNDLNAEADLSTYTTEFGLPACAAANGCFKQVNENGSEAPSELPFPKTSSELQASAKGTAQQRAHAEEAEGWALETATDVEMARAVCHNCHILLVEASSTGYRQLETAEDAAATLGATEISNSWGGEEEGTDNPAFNHPGIVVTAAAGDDGYLNWDQYATRQQAGSPYFEGTDYPATSPHVVSVGGTRLNLGAGGAWQSEAAWNSGGAGGGGCSSSLPAPEWQRDVADWASVGCGENRASTDVSADADPSTGVDVYDSTPYPEAKKTTVLGWLPIGGTSVASPIIASMFALAGGAQGVEYPAQTLYSHLGSSLLHDVHSGGNGECDDQYVSCSGSMEPLSPDFPLDCGQGVWICNTTTGYDGPTGVGTPNGVDVFKPGEGVGKSGEEGKATNKGSEEGSKSEGPSKGGGGEESKGNEGGGSEESKGSGTEGSGPEGGKNSGGGSEAPGTAKEAGTGGPSAGSASQPSGSSSPEPAHDGSPGSPRSPATSDLPTRISALTLTANARAALARGALDRSLLAFSFRLNRAATVRVTLAVRIGSGSRLRWHALPASLSFAAVRGINRRRLRGSGQLPAGVYRLLVTPAGGRASSIRIRVP